MHCCVRSYFFPARSSCASSLKLNLNGDLRRVRLATPTFDDLVALVVKTFPSLSPTPVIRYEDEEGDVITLTNDAELAEALAVSASASRTLVLKLSTPSATTTTTTATAAAPAPTAAAAPAPAPAPITVDDLRRLVGVMRTAFAADPSVAFSLLPLLSDPAVGPLVAKAMPALPDVNRVLQIVAADPATPALLGLPVLAPYVAAAGITVPARSAPATPVFGAAASPPTAGFPMLPLMAMLSQLNLGDLASCGGGSAVHGDDDDDSSSSSSSDDEAGPAVDRKAAKKAAKEEKKRKKHESKEARKAEKAARKSEREQARKLRKRDGADGTSAGAGAGEGAPATDAVAVHANVTCDGCGVHPIVGDRYKCTVREDFDLCTACEASGKFGPHAMLKIRTPAAAPAGLVTLLREDQPGPDGTTATPTADTDPDWRRHHAKRFWHAMGARGPHAHGGPWNRHGRCRAAMAAAFSADATATATATATSGAATPVVPTSADSEEAQIQAAIQASLRPVDVTYEARFLNHLTMTETQPITPGKLVVKKWRMKNEGRTAWPVGTRLINVGASLMGAPAEGVAVPPVAPGETVDISLTLTAPDLPGRHVGYWRLVTPEGVRFGHRIWADMYVENSNATDVLRLLTAQSAAAAATTTTVSDVGAGAGAAPVPLPLPIANPVAIATPYAPVEAVATVSVVETAPVPDVTDATPALTTTTVDVDTAAALPVDSEYVTVASTLPSAPVGLPLAPIEGGEGRWDAQLIVLNEMGLYDVDANIAALEATHGDVSRAVNRLFGMDTA